MCDCLNERKKMLFEHFERENKQDGRTLISVNILGISTHSFNKKALFVTNNDIEVVYEKTSKTGHVKKTRWKPYISHTFCPFCGVKYKEEKEVSSE